MNVSGITFALPLFPGPWRVAGAPFALLPPENTARRRPSIPTHVTSIMLREFRDRAGTIWRVWDVYPSARGMPERRPTDASAQMLPHRELEEGWLCFESRSEKRRLTPIPPGWESWDADALEEICSRAGYISSGQRPRQGA